MLYSSLRHVEHLIDWRFSLPPCLWLTLNQDWHCIHSRLNISLIITVIKIASYLCFFPLPEIANSSYTASFSTPRNLPKSQTYALSTKKICRLKEGGMMKEAEIRITRHHCFVIHFYGLVIGILIFNSVQYATEHIHNPAKPSPLPLQVKKHPFLSLLSNALAQDISVQPSVGLILQRLLTPQVKFRD